MIIGFSIKERDQLVIFNQLKEGQITQIAASKMLQFSVRWVRKKFKRFLALGAAGLVHQSRNKPSSKAWNIDQKKLMGVFYLKSRTFHFAQTGTFYVALTKNPSNNFT